MAFFINGSRQKDNVLTTDDRGSPLNEIVSKVLSPCARKVKRVVKIEPWLSPREQ